MKNIFISSTFRDMQAERDMVQERVIPALREEAHKYGENVNAIDLRWGVDTSTLEEEEGSAKVLKVCLDEIDRSHPYMLIFLGERYGTVMKEEQIKRSIRGREDKYITDDYVKSITALEIEYGALSEKYGEMEHCVVCFREPVFSQLDESEKRIYGEQNEIAKKKLESLKARIQQDLGESDRLIIYSAKWDKSAHKLVNFIADGKPLEEVLIKRYIEMFQNDWREYEKLTWQEKEQLSFGALMETKLRSFVGRTALLEEYYQSVLTSTKHLVLRGEVGSGKTALMCKIIDRLQKEGKHVFSFFSGSGSMSSNAELLVKQMVYCVENLLGVEKHFLDKEENQALSLEGMANDLNLYFDTENKMSFYMMLIEKLNELCSQLPEGEKIYFCIDALDQLRMDEHVEQLDFFITRKNVQIIASCTDTFKLPMDIMMRREEKMIPPLNDEDAKEVANGILASFSRNTYMAIEQEILKKESIGKPLYISLLIQRLNMMDAEELKDVAGEDEIISLGTKIIREMPDEIEDAIVTIIKNGIEKVSKKTAYLEVALNLIAVSRNGLRMQDLQALFDEHNRQLLSLDMTLLMKYLDTFFYLHDDGRIDFTHKVIRKGLLKELGNERWFYEELVKEHIKSLDRTDILRISEGMYFARIRKDEEFARALIEQAYDENQEELIKSITNEAIEDEGELYCKLIKKEYAVFSKVRKFVQLRLMQEFKCLSRDMRTKNNIANILMIQVEKAYENNKCNEILSELVSCYYDMAYIAKELGAVNRAIAFSEKNIEFCEKLCANDDTEKNIRRLAAAYGGIGMVLKDANRINEALVYMEKMMVLCEELFVKNNSYINEKNKYACYGNMGYILNRLNRKEESIKYYEKELEWLINTYKRTNDDDMLETLLMEYDNIGIVLSSVKRVSEALLYHRKALQGWNELYIRKPNEKVAKAILTCMSCIGNDLLNLQDVDEAFEYLGNVVKQYEKLYKSTRNDATLRELLTTYNDLGRVLLRKGNISEAIVYFEKYYEGSKNLYERYPTSLSLREVGVSSGNLGHAIMELGRESRAYNYFCEELNCYKKLYKIETNTENLYLLHNAYRDIGWAWEEFGRLDEAYKNYKKGYICLKVVCDRETTKANLEQLILIYMRMGDVLLWDDATKALGFYEEMLQNSEKLKKMSGEVGINFVAISYRKLGVALEKLERKVEALEFYFKQLDLFETEYKINSSEQNLREIKNSYYYICEVLQALERDDAAHKYFEKEIMCREILFKKSQSRDDLQMLILRYNQMIQLLKKLGRNQEAQNYFEKRQVCEGILNGE